MSWNIAGKFHMLKLAQLQNYLENFDIVCLTETHSTTLKTVSFPKLKMYEYPEKHCNYEYPRGGTCLLIKHEIRKLIKHISLLMTYFIRITFNNNTKIYNLYIPPSDSVYYDEQYVELLCSSFIEGESDVPKIAIGDLNARIGNLNSISEQYQYDANVDSGTNENGRHLSQILFNTTTAIPLNHLQHDTDHRPASTTSVCLLRTRQ